MNVVQNLASIAFRIVYQPENFAILVEIVYNAENHTSPQWNNFSKSLKYHAVRKWTKQEKENAEESETTQTSALMDDKTAVSDTKNRLSKRKTPKHDEDKHNRAQKEGNPGRN